MYGTRMQLAALVAFSVIAAPARSSAATCTAPIVPVDTSVPNVVVGNGTAASCTEAAFAAAVRRGGKITFSCGGAATIRVNSQKALRTDVDTTVDGEGLITLDGQGRTRILSFDSPNFRANTTRVTLQNLTFVNGRSTGSRLPSAPPPCSQGYDIDAGGAAVFVRDGILRVINSTFVDNRTASPGPDVGGGAIYALGSLETTIVGSRFTRNQGSNAGAIGALFTNLTIYNSRFNDNVATGDGANNISSSCPVRGGQVGNGGNGGAVAMDGAEAFAAQVCGSTFVGNRAGARALAGALFRTANAARQATVIDRSTFDGNRAPQGGAVFVQNAALTIKGTTFSNNVATGVGGAVFASASALDFTNDTFFANVTREGLGGALFSSSGSGSLTNVTFSRNRAAGGSGYFGAALHTDAALTIRNTLIDRNTSQDCGQPMACSGALNGGSPNQQWPRVKLACPADDRPCSSGTVFRNPALSDTLADNGGPTETLLPSPRSPARGAGANCPATDQRGVARPATGCTLGAVQ